MRHELVYIGELERELARVKERNREEKNKSEGLVEKINKMESQASRDTRKIVKLEEVG